MFVFNVQVINWHISFLLLLLLLLLLLFLLLHILYLMFKYKTIKISISWFGKSAKILSFKKVTLVTFITKSPSKWWNLPSTMFFPRSSHHLEPRCHSRHICPSWACALSAAVKAVARKNPPYYPPIRPTHKTRTVKSNLQKCSERWTRSRQK